MKDEFLFSKELREKLAQFGEMDAREALSSPEFLNALLDYAGMDEKQKSDLWDKIGKPNFKMEN